MTAEPLSKDPAAAWRDLVAQWEKNVNEFSKAVNQAMGLSAGMQSSLSEAMGRYLASLNLPSRTEMAGIGERLNAIEERLDRVLTLLQLPAGAAKPSGAAATAKPPRTKRPPDRGGKP
jgi:hypothetical protein